MAQKKERRKTYYIEKRTCPGLCKHREDRWWRRWKCVLCVEWWFIKSKMSIDKRRKHKRRDKDNEATVQTKDTKHRFYREYFESNIFAQLVRFSFVQFVGSKFYATLTICLNISDPNKNRSGFRCHQAVVKDTVIKTNYTHQMVYSGGKYVRLPVEW